MDHKAHVRFIDSHAEGNGRDHHLQVITQESILHPLALFRRKSCMISRSLDPFQGKLLRNFLDPFATQTVNDPCLVATLAEKDLQLQTRFLLVHDSIADIRSVEPCDNRASLMKSESLQNILTGLPLGSCGQGDNRHIWKIFPQSAQLNILRAEIMTPL